MSDALKRNNSLIQFMINHSKIEEIHRILESLVQHPSLEVFSLYGTSLNNMAVKYIGKLLQQNKSLRTLYLIGTNMSTSDNDYIVNTLQTNTSITNIKLDDFSGKANQICERNIHNAYQKNITLIELSN